jgi:superfamily II DNA or RNA helicase
MKIKNLETLDNNLRVKITMTSIPKKWVFGESYNVTFGEEVLLIKILEINRIEKYIIGKKFQPMIYAWTTKSYRKSKIYKVGLVNYQSVNERLSQTDTTGVIEPIELVEEFPLFTMDSKTTHKIETDIHNELRLVRKNREGVQGDWKKEIRPTILKIISKHTLNTNCVNNNIPTPRYYQYDGKIAAGNHYEKHDRGWFQWFCRTGKTNGTFWMYQEIFNRIKIKNNIVIIFVPNLHLVNQTCDDWTGIATLYGYKVKQLKIGNEEGMTTDEDKISGWIKETTTDTLNLIVSTYHSSDKISTATKISGVIIDLIINDEAHKITGNDGKAWKRCLENSFIKRRKTISTTASPIEYTATSLGYSGFENEKMFGKKFHEYHFLDAMFDGVISPLQILGIEVSKDDIEYVNRLIEQRRDIIQKNLFDFDNIDFSEIENEVNVNQGYFTFYLQLHNTLCCLRDGVFTHPIIYANSIRRITYFFACLKALAPHYEVNIDYFEIFTSKNSNSKERINSLNNKFPIAKIGVVGNVYCLQEGITIPCADANVMIDPRSSGPSIIQSGSRPLGLDINNPNKLATFLLPIILEKDENGKFIINPSMWSVTRDWLINICSSDEDMENYVLNDLRFYTPKVKLATEVKNVRPDNRRLPSISGRPRNTNPIERQIENVNFEELLSKIELKKLMSTEKTDSKLEVNPDKINQYVQNQTINYILEYKIKIEESLKKYNIKNIKKYSSLIKSKEDYINDISLRLNTEENNINFVNDLPIFNELLVLSKKLKEKNNKKVISIL